MSDLTTHKGHCHCNAVTWEIQAPAKLRVDDCNCSICNMMGFQHIIVPKSRFTLLTGKDSLTLYTFNSHAAQHYFCKTCGVKSFYIPRSNPDGVSVNFRCMDRDNVEESEILPFDGQNWEKNAAELVHLSKD
ncbi:glutathione-dependent formaldehyde-activating [Martensiomyces pterosporus]|nr:glutathione-dependent formaldehyde-activating [Martensiomyces pterosporus]